MGNVSTTAEFDEFNFLQLQLIATHIFAMSKSVIFPRKDGTASAQISCISFLSLRYGSMVQDSFATSTLLVNSFSTERTVDILLSMWCFLRWSRMDLSSMLIMLWALHWRQQRPNGEKVKSSRIGSRGSISVLCTGRRTETTGLIIPLTSFCIGGELDDGMMGMSLHVCHDLQYVHGTCIAPCCLVPYSQYSTARCVCTPTYLLLSQVCR